MGVLAHFTNGENLPSNLNDIVINFRSVKDFIASNAYTRVDAGAIIPKARKAVYGKIVHLRNVIQSVKASDKKERPIFDEAFSSKTVLFLDELQRMSFSDVSFVVRRFDTLAVLLVDLSCYTHDQLCHRHHTIFRELGYSKFEDIIVVVNKDDSFQETFERHNYFRSYKHVIYTCDKQVLKSYNAFYDFYDNFLRGICIVNAFVSSVSGEWLKLNYPYIKSLRTATYQEFDTVINGRYFLKLFDDRNTFCLYDDKLKLVLCGSRGGADLRVFRSPRWSDSCPVKDCRQPKVDSSTYHQVLSDVECGFIHLALMNASTLQKMLPVKVDCDANFAKAVMALFDL